MFDCSANATVYLDGRFVSSVNDSYLGSVDSGAVFNIGQDPTGAYNADAQADLDDLGVWKRALTQLEVSGMHLAGSQNSPGVSFAPVVIGIPATPTTVGSLSGGAATLSYSGGSGSRFVLVGTNNVAGPLANWTRIATNTVTPGSFTIPAVGSAVGPMYYRVKSE